MAHILSTSVQLVHYLVQVKFKLDPLTILVDPCLPAASTMESVLVSTPTNKQDQNSIKDNYANDYANKDDDLGAEYGTRIIIDDQEETDTGSTVSSVVAADNYKYV